MVLNSFQANQISLSLAVCFADALCFTGYFLWIDHFSVLLSTNQAFPHPFNLPWTGEENQAPLSPQ
jgi:hypothetical protein